MNDNREKLLQQMDMALAKQKDKIEAIQDKETKKRPRRHSKSSRGITL